ncbi:uncharacterized protein LOC129000331 [Macrosteles quadrilineatus]|uniref:uncharacterized protein LOC129000331 n=1 Tax=Macrosteles quadrilineatus TaxID=74068 RepID=UPI0023E2D87C|nr:uncharacterized protein LOC129000331 [Macrosteles quadrilineatus]
MGLIKDCLLMWKAKHKTGNHQDMDPSNYKKWLSEKLIPNLPPRSVLVIDNASYQNVEVEKCPTSNSKKADMHTWLMKKGVPFSNNMLKVELLQLIDIHKSGHKRYVIDEMLGEHGHTALKLPPYHPELNSIELIRAKVNWVEEQNVSFKLDEVENLTRQKLESITTEFWKKICDDTKTIEREFLQNQGPMEDAIDSLVINLEIKSSGEEESPASENTDDSDGNISGDEDEEFKYEENF